jgi:hypothetical protein
MLRRGEDELRARVRAALGPDRFADVFAAGTRLNQREAIAVAREIAGRWCPNHLTGGLAPR